jgi:hypothetical protein
MVGPGFHVSPTVLRSQANTSELGRPASRFLGGITLSVVTRFARIAARFGHQRLPTAAADDKPRPVSARAAGLGAYTGPRLWLARERRLPRPLQVHPQKKSAPESAQSAEVERRKLLANGAGLTRRCGDRLAKLDHGGVGHAGAVGDARGKANADDQRREDERHCHNLQVGKAGGGKQRKIVHDTLPSRGEKKRAAGVVRVRRLVLAPRGLTGLLNPCVKSGTKLFQPCQQIGKLVGEGGIEFGQFSSELVALGLCLSYAARRRSSSSNARSCSSRSCSRDSA